VIPEPIHTPFKSVAWLLKVISAYYFKNFKPATKSTPDAVAAPHLTKCINPQEQAVPAPSNFKTRLRKNSSIYRIPLTIKTNESFASTKVTSSPKKRPDRSRVFPKRVE
jgi:hypothetical protein